jgi:hypothetical protein
MQKAGSIAHYQPLPPTTPLPGQPSKPQKKQSWDVLKFRLAARMNVLKLQKKQQQQP